MKGKHSTEEKKGAMARRLVYFCIGMLTEAAIWAQILATLAAVKGWTIDLGTILGAVLSFMGLAFGGELLFLLLKRILAKPNETERETTEEGNG